MLLTTRRTLLILITVATPIVPNTFAMERDRSKELEEMPYGVVQEPWEAGLGNHRARVQVEGKEDAVWVRVPWRRRDLQPDRKEIVIVDATTNRRVDNVVRVNVNREFGDLLFQPLTAPGEYFVYFLPYQTHGAAYAPTTVYLPASNRADEAWSKACAPIAKRIESDDARDLPRAKVLEIQAINSFHRCDPMEVIALRDEVQQLLAGHANRPYLVFPEDRRFPIRMTDDLPLRWIRAGAGSTFEGSACRGEFYTFQIGIYAARQSLTDLKADFTDLRADHGQTISAHALRCFNFGGVDSRGRAFSKTVDVPQRRVQPLWFGVQVPADATPAVYRGSVTLQPKNAPPLTVDLSLQVTEQQMKDAGDGELWRHSRLRWLDSTIGLDQQVVAPFTPMKLADRTIELLGRRIRFNEFGLLESIQSTFTGSVDATDAVPTELLAGPMRFIVGDRNWSSKVDVVEQTTDMIGWKAHSQSAGLELSCEAIAECDGYVDFKLTLRSSEAADLNDIALEIPLRRECASLMMGMGHKGGKRPSEWKWQWDENRANNQLWIGDVNAGLGLKLKHVEPRWDLYNLRQTGPYRDWSQGGQGGCAIREEANRVVIRCFAGPRKVAVGEELHFNFGLLITPFKPLDKSHWNWRYVHRRPPPSAAEAADLGAKIINIHQGGSLNPYINYPFLTTDKISRYIREAHDRGLKVKLYYTVRELSNYAAELWALRSLGNEIFLDGPGFKLADQFTDKKSVGVPTGGSWLCEHLVGGYVPAWHDPLGPGHYDASMATAGLSRWHNYYLEGLNWLCRNVEIDGLYLDGIGYDREIMKRVRKVLDRARPGSLIDFHSGNNFHPDYGLSSPANQYLESFPYLDGLWLGEGYNPDESPDYWLVEMSGIPFGLFSEMLEGGGNPWRGILYGMTSRLGWSGDPRPIWKLWDDFGIHDAKMIGYWDAGCPVKTDDKDILATVYRKQNKAMIALASWATEPRKCRLIIHWKSLGLDPEKTIVIAPEVSGWQAPMRAATSDEISVAAGGGQWLILDEQPPVAPATFSEDAQ